MTKYRDPGFALANFALSAHMLQMLRNLELITEEEAWEVVEQALLDLEIGQGIAQPKDRETFRSARRYLEMMRKALAPQKDKRRRKRRREQ